MGLRYILNGYGCCTLHLLSNIKINVSLTVSVANYEREKPKKQLRIWLLEMIENKIRNNVLQTTYVPPECCFWWDLRETLFHKEVPRWNCNIDSHIHSRRLISREISHQLVLLTFIKMNAPVKPYQPQIWNW